MLGPKPDRSDIRPIDFNTKNVQVIDVESLKVWKFENSLNHRLYSYVFYSKMEDPDLGLFRAHFGISQALEEPIPDDYDEEVLEEPVPVSY